MRMAMPMEIGNKNEKNWNLYNFFYDQKIFRKKKITFQPEIIEALVCAFILVFVTPSVTQLQQVFLFVYNRNDKRRI